MPRKIVRVFVPLTVAEFFCAGVVGVLEVARDRNRFPRSNIRQGGIDGLDDAVALVGAGDVDGGLGDRYPGLGPTDELGGLERRVGQHQSHRVGQANVLGGMDDDAAGNEARIFPGVNHLRQPVKRRIDIAATHRLDECGDRVVVRVLVAVVHHRFFLDAVFGNLQGDTNNTVGIRRCGQRGDLQRVQRLARIAVGHSGQVLHRLGSRLAFQVSQTPFLVAKGAFDQAGDLLL